MARYTGPKARINRRLGTLIYETAGAARALDRRPQHNNTNNMEVVTEQEQQIPTHTLSDSDLALHKISNETPCNV